MIELLLSVELTCANAQSIVDRMMSIDYMSQKEKIEVVRELENAIPNCKLNTKTK